MNNRIETRQSANKALADAVNKGANLDGCNSQTIAKAGVRTHDAVLYVTGEITSGGPTEFFKDITKKAVGVTNFNRNQLPTLENAVIDAVALEYGTVTVASNAGDFETAVKNVSFKTAAPDWLLNSEVRFSCAGKKLIDLPGFELHNVNSGNSKDDDYRSIGDLPIIEAQKDNTFEIETNGTVDASTNRHFVRLALRVSKTGERR